MKHGLLALTLISVTKLNAATPVIKENATYSAIKIKKPILLINNTLQEAHKDKALTKENIKLPADCSLQFKSNSQEISPNENLELKSYYLWIDKDIEVAAVKDSFYTYSLTISTSEKQNYTLTLYCKNEKAQAALLRSGYFMSSTLDQNKEASKSVPQLVLNENEKTFTLSLVNKTP